MGLPFVIVQIAANQKLNARAWHFAGAAVDMGDLDTLDPIKLRNVLDELIADSGKRKEMFQAGRALVDCKGTQRVARILMGQDVK